MNNAGRFCYEQFGSIITDVTRAAFNCTSNSNCTTGNWKSRERETRRERETGTGNGNGKLASFPGHFDCCDRSKTGGGNGLGTRLTVRSVGRNVHDGCRIDLRC